MREACAYPLMICETQTHHCPPRHVYRISGVDNLPNPYTNNKHLARKMHDFLSFSFSFKFHYPANTEGSVNINSDMLHCSLDHLINVSFFIFAWNSPHVFLLIGQLQACLFLISYVNFYTQKEHASFSFLLKSLFFKHNDNIIMKMKHTLMCHDLISTLNLSSSQIFEMINSLCRSLIWIFCC